MPRLTSSLLRRARRLDPFLPLLLRPCRDLPSALNELRWLREHALKQPARGSGSTQQTWQQRLHSLCIERSKGKPLQYILGSQPFGDLDVICRPGVLIPRSAALPSLYQRVSLTVVPFPRPETESITIHLASLITEAFCRQTRLDLIRDIGSIGYHHKSPLRILDLCTGTGCIPLLLHALLAPTFPHLQIAGVDISPAAIALAKENVAHNIALGYLRQNDAKSQLEFCAGDICAETDGEAARTENQWVGNTAWDIVVSNPPYISPRDFDTTTAKSVRNYEPHEALVPLRPGQGAHPDTEDGDTFYPHILRLARSFRAKILLVEVVDLAQAIRVAAMILGSRRWAGCEIWRDYPGQGGSKEARKTIDVDGRDILVKGEGNGRAVLAWSSIGGL